MASTVLGSTSNMSSSGTKVWEKTVQDANDVDELFSNARDVGFVRLNQYRTTVVGKMSKYDSTDIYKVQVQSNSKFTLTLKTVDDGIKRDELASAAEVDENELMKMTADGLRVQVYTMRKNGKETLVADSGATEGTKKYENMNDMLTGNYKAQKGDLYVKISRSDDVSKNSEIPYALQMSQGSAKHDYIVTETASQDTKDKKYTKTPSVSQYSSSLGTVSASNAMQILATVNQGASDMLSIGYAGMAEIYNKNNGS